MNKWGSGNFYPQDFLKGIVVHSIFLKGIFKPKTSLKGNLSFEKEKCLRGLTLRKFVEKGASHFSTMVLKTKMCGQVINSILIYIIKIKVTTFPLSGIANLSRRLFWLFLIRVACQILVSFLFKHEKACKE